MRFPLFIAGRYLFAKKSHNAINIITMVSVVGVAVGTMALIVVLSVFNGFERLILSLFNAFHPDLEISLAEGKSFSMEHFPAGELKDVPGLIRYGEVVEETAMLTYRDRQHLVRMRGVSENFRHMTGLDTLMVEGTFILQEGERNYMVLGQGVAYTLGANINDFLNPLSIYVPRRGPTSFMHPAQAFQAASLYASGVFAVQAEFDMEYVVVPIRLARHLLEYTDEVTSVILMLEADAPVQRVQASIEALLGPDYLVKNRLQQQDFLYRIMQSEKWAIFFILSFILVIAAFNVIGSLTMLVLEKKEDIQTLHKLGASRRTIRRAFIMQGMMVSAGGALGGLLLGGFLCWLQMRFGLIRIQADGAYIIDAYPVAMQFADFFLVAVTVTAIGLLASSIPAAYIMRSGKTS